MFDAECDTRVPENETLAPTWKKLLLGLHPVVADAYIDDQGHRKHRGLLHLVLDNARHDLDFIRRSLENKLVMNLKDHLRSQARYSQRVVDPDHGDLDQISGRPLNG